MRIRLLFEITFKQVKHNFFSLISQNTQTQRNNHLLFLKSFQLPLTNSLNYVPFTKKRQHRAEEEVRVKAQEGSLELLLARRWRREKGCGSPGNWEWPPADSNETGSSVLQWEGPEFYQWQEWSWNKFSSVSGQQTLWLQLYGSQSREPSHAMLEFLTYRTWANKWVLLKREKGEREYSTKLCKRNQLLCHFWQILLKTTCNTLTYLG